MNTTTPFWKKIYQTVTGHSKTITEDIVAEILNLSKNELLEGLLPYKPFKKKGFDEWVTDSTISSCMREFVNTLSKEINLDISVAYPMMCTFLMFEYYGKIKDFWQISRIATTLSLKSTIVNFYIAERMFLIKTLRHVFEHVKKRNYFSNQYCDFVESIDIEQLQENLIKTFELLIHEVTPKVLDEKSQNYQNWICRNAREQIEVLLVLTLTINQQSLKLDQMKQLTKLFIQKNFSTDPELFQSMNVCQNQDSEDLMYAQIGCFFVVLDDLWISDTGDFWEKASTKELDNLLLHLHLNPGHAVVILLWLVLRFRKFQREEDVIRIIELFKFKPFSFLLSILSNRMFEDNAVGEVVVKAIHRMVDTLSLMYDDPKRFYQETEIVSLLGKFLKYPDLTETCLKTRNGVDRIFEIAIETFPFAFFSLSTLAKALLMQESQFDNTINLLNNIPTYLSEMTWSTESDKIVVLKKSQNHTIDSDIIVFLPNTVVKSYSILGENLIQYKSPYSYFAYLEYLVVQLLKTGIQQHEFDEDLIRRVVVGFQIVETSIRNSNSMSISGLGVGSVLSRLNKILVVLDGPLLNYDLVKLYFGVQSALIECKNYNIFNLCPEIVWKFFFPKLKKEYLGSDFRQLLLNTYAFEDTIFMKLLKEEQFQDDHSLLLIFINILTNMIERKVQNKVYKTIKFSGIMYLLNFVFLQQHSWTYKDVSQKNEIVYQLVKLFHYILQEDPEKLPDENAKIVHLVRDAFFYNIYVIDSFLRLFVKEKYYLMHVMERDTNWTKGQNIDNLKCIRMQLAFLLLLMTQKKTLGKCNLDDRLPLVVKPIASYFTNSYSVLIAELSCRFLEKLAQDNFIPLLAFLELDHYQVQCLFLEKLRDPLEEENVKLAVIDLINSCISNQDGMTAAFFNLKCLMYWDGTENDIFSGDSVSDFMVDYLQNIKKSHEYFKNPLQLGILRLLYNLWLNHRENLIDNIANLKEFWPVMFDPFFCEFAQEVEVYAVILGIVNLEITANVDSVEEKLVNTLDKFLKNNKQLNTWIKFILKECQNPENINLLHAWSEFLVLTKKYSSKIFSDDIKLSIIYSCLDGMNCPECCFKNIEVVYSWCQLYFILISSWKTTESQNKIIMAKSSKFVHSVKTYYKHLPPKIKEIILCIINKTVQIMTNRFRENIDDLVNFLYAIGMIIDDEHNYLIHEVWHDEEERVEKLKPWLLVISIGNSLLRLHNIEELSLWFYYRNFLKRIMESAEPMLQNQNTIPFVKLVVDHLINYAQSPLAKDFLKLDFDRFYYKLGPPNLTFSLVEFILNGVRMNLKEWWLIIIGLIKLNRILLLIIGEPMIETCFAFIQQHDNLLLEIFSLIKHTVDMTALTLVCEALQFVYVFMKTKPYWRVQASHSYNKVLEGIGIAVNSSVLSIIGYKKIKFYNITGGKVVNIIDADPDALLISVLNKLTEIIYWTCNCLRMHRPNLISQLNAEQRPEHPHLMITIDFSVPRFEVPSTNQLTYGMLLCLVDFLCKALNHLPHDMTSSTSCHRLTFPETTTKPKPKSLEKNFGLFLENFENCMGFMVYIQKTEDLPNEKLTSLLHYDMSEFSSASTLAQLDYNLVKKSLESLMLFLTSEIFFTVRVLDEETLFSYKRELSSEIKFFYEFARKRTGELYNSLVSTPRLALPQNENDIIKKYIVTKLNGGKLEDVVEENFVMVIAQWLVKVCHLSN